MNTKQYLAWKKMMLASLLLCYSKKEAEYIVNFWDGIKGSREKEMLGDKNFKAMRKMSDDMFFKQDGLTFEAKMASQWSHRCWLYAPTLALEYRKEQERLLKNLNEKTGQTLS